MTSFDQPAGAGPQLTEPAVRAIVRERYGFEPSALKWLGSFQDQNVRVEHPAGRRFVLKIANASADPAALDLQNRALAHLAGRDTGFAFPELLPALGGVEMFLAEHAGAAYLVRMLTYLPGTVLAQATRAPSAELLAALGRCAGSLVRELEGFDHPAGDTPSQWDLQHAPVVITAFLTYVQDHATRALVERFLSSFQTECAPLLPALPKSMIHGDITSYNTLVARDADGQLAISGLVDFGDMARSYRVAELAVAVAETALDGARDPLAGAAAMVGAFHREAPLGEAEMAALFPLICLRRAVVAVSTAQELHLDPANDYVRELSLQDLPALEQLAAIPPALAHALFRAACGFEPHPAAGAIVRWLEAQRGRLSPIVAPELFEGAPALDLGPESLALRDGAWQEPAHARAAIERALGATAGLGRYAEARLLHSAAGSPTEGSALHLGADLFLPAETPLCAPLDGAVELLAPGELILRHAPADGPVFFSRYARVRPADDLAAGDAVAAGRPIARVAPAPPDRPLPPHAHIQLGAELLLGGLPGLARASQRAAWLSLCPDPNLLLGLPQLAPAAPTNAATLYQRRSRVVQQAQEYYYRRPMQIVRGWRQYLYDDGGRAYLDAINNVAHVGHSHPRVVAAAARQMALLNTNSRFLYGSMVAYAERLTALLPEPLKVVFFTCSGSEANDLALRLARAATGQRDVIVIDGEYHGNTVAVDEISTSLLDNPSAKQARPWVHPVTRPDSLRGAHAGQPNAGALYAAEAQAAIERVRGEGRGVAAFFTESLLGSSGGIALPEGYLRAVYAHIRAAGGVCIADEVQVGFGRMGTHFWAFETQGVVPDIVTMGKPIGNGHPLSAVVTTPAIADAFRQSATYFNTYGGNPVSCEVGLAVLDVIEQEGLQAQALDVGRHFRAGLRELQRRHALVGAVYGLGMYMGAELVRDRASWTPASGEAMQVAERMRELGVIVYPTGDHYNILKIKPPLAFTRDNADFFVERLDEVLTQGV